MSTLGNGIALEGVKALIGFAVDRLKRTASGTSHSEEALRRKIEQAVFDTLQWSAAVQVFGMAAPRDIETDTVPLRFGSPTRLPSTPRTIDETELLSETGPLVILGAPGAGKTTTVKRLARLTVFGPSRGQADALLPWVLRFREFKAKETILTRIADVLGIPWTVQAGGAPHRRCYRYKSGEALLVDVLTPILDATRCCLFLDGLDEFPTSSLDDVLDEIEELSRKLCHGRIVLTTRAGHFSYNLEGFGIFQIHPIAPLQVDEIVRRWSAYPGDFKSAIREVPYRDLIDRPLFLIQLILIHNQDRTLPDQPSRVYKSMTRLLLQEWDRQNRTTRETRYAHFEPERKADFLAAMAYALTFLPTRKTFDTSDLEGVYGKIHRQFGLPAGEAKQVVEELETHTGIIQASGASSFEFAHLSLQEYLAADHLVRSPYPENLPKYLSDYPAVLSIAVALSSDPSQWLSSLVLPSWNRARLGRDGLAVFNERLRLERPYFRETPFLGTAVWLLDESLGRDIDWLVSDPVVEEAMAHALTYYAVDPIEARSGRVRLTSFATPSSTLNLALPESIGVSGSRVAVIAKKHNVPLAYYGPDGRRFTRAGEASPLKWLFNLGGP